ncbi:unnamed protein product [Amoebophrya sp. A25]|nr:unnamed protein product [Amoebophrya sp. A25]|eukprot:GSA25T00021832001.1
MGRSQRQRTQRERRSCASRAATTAATAGVLTVSAVSFTRQSRAGVVTQDPAGAGAAGGASSPGLARGSGSGTSSAVAEVSTHTNKPGQAGAFCGQVCPGDDGNDEEAKKKRPTGSQKRR